MADETKLNITLRVAKGQHKLNWTPGVFLHDQDEAGVYHRTVAVSAPITVDTTLTGFAAHRMVIVRFIDLIGGSGATGAVRVYPAGGSEYNELAPGDVTILKSDDVTIDITDDDAEVEIIVVAE